MQPILCAWFTRRGNRHQVLVDNIYPDDDGEIVQHDRPELW